MKNLDQVNSQNNECLIETQPAKLCRSHELDRQLDPMRQRVQHFTNEAALRPEPDKPSQIEAMVFGDIVRDILENKFQRDFENGISQLEGLHLLIQDNPRMTPFAAALSSIIEGAARLNQLCGAANRL